MRISDWSSDVCSSDLPPDVSPIPVHRFPVHRFPAPRTAWLAHAAGGDRRRLPAGGAVLRHPLQLRAVPGADVGRLRLGPRGLRSEEHTSELQSLMRISYAVFCLKKKKIHT